MTGVKRYLMVTATLSALLLGGSIGSAVAAEARVVDGNLWVASTDAEKRAYMVGVADTLALQQAILAKKGVKSPESITRLSDVLQDVTAERAVEEIDNWYEANPSRMAAPVLGVVWLSIVEAR
ncbi:MAG: hypothetical protein LJF30_10270 [Acidobacteria bacterium]|nr:hypothetical protein [Acidobacteriota bacterium]